MRFAFYSRLSASRKRIYDRSDAIVSLPLPAGEDLAPIVANIGIGLAHDRESEVGRACQSLLDQLVKRFAVPPIRVKVYSVRPSDDRGELHGLYSPEDAGKTAVIELWMRTAQLQKVVAPRTFLRTLVHEFCHHLDYERFKLEETFHTEGFYKRESHLLNQLAGPPAKRGSQLKAPSSTTATGTRGARAQSNS